MSIKVKFCIENEVKNIENFVKAVKENNELNSCELV